MVADAVAAFVRESLPPAPARVLEVGAGEGDLARLLAADDYDVVAVDPRASTPEVLPIPLAELAELAASFDAAVAVLSLHHVHGLDASCAHLASLLRPGAPLAIDEFDVERLDERAAGWWLEQRRLLGFDDDLTAGEIVARHREELHPLGRIQASLEPFFELRLTWRGAYLYRWNLDGGVRGAEERLIAAGELPALGVRLLGRRRDDPPERQPAARSPIQ